MEEIKYVDQPLKEYDSYKSLHTEKTKEYFDKLVEKSQINVEENKALNKKIEQNQDKASKESSTLKKLKFGKAVNIIIIVLAALTIIGSSVAIHLIKSQTAFTNSSYLGPSLALSFSIVIFIALIIVQILVINKRIKQRAQILAQLNEKISSQIQKAYEQLAPLVDMFKFGMKLTIFNQTMPFVKLDKYFSNEKLAKLKEEYGFVPKDSNESMVVGLQSGSIYGNPFVYKRDLNHKLGTKTYYGSITISWVTYVLNSEGRRVPHTHTQTLTASLDKPYPYYSGKTTLLFGSHAAPDLSFKREAQKIHALTEKQRAKLVKNTEKILKKRQEKQTSFTALSNTKFETYWNALDRDNEQQYRLLFTPLAQNNICELLTDNEKGYGDDFSFRKLREMNFIRSESLTDFEFIEDLQRLKDYNFDRIQNEFNRQNSEYFKHIYFSLAPYFSIPIYQQTKSLDFIYKDWSKGKMSKYEHEYQLSFLDRDLFKHRKVKTEIIMKTQFIDNKDGFENLKVHSFGYDIVPRTEYVLMRGGDGKMHNVPVHWDEYIRYDNEVKAKIHPMESLMSDENYAEEFFEFDGKHPEQSASKLMTLNALVNVI
ncbi:MAG1210 family protein [Mycoplasma simbae]|uniref:MAG1210 family protein n=1 Tax=Mycoplasma simbae TaxID=36744 RepID=UPI00068AFB51|nr:hypothetical protein [Mycoplasma simbae]